MKNSNAAEDLPSAALLSFRDRFAGSKQFAQLYREGMDLVEETAEYLDRAGRLESKQLTPPASLAYTSESIKLTTRLTQLASWLLVRRAIASGEITEAEAHLHRHKVALTAQTSALPEGFNALPETFRRLISESHRLYGRVLRLERLMNEGYTAEGQNGSPVLPQIERIRHAFPAA
jgi:regulator of CtrA degradation